MNSPLGLCKEEDLTISYLIVRVSPLPMASIRLDSVGYEPLRPCKKDPLIPPPLLRLPCHLAFK